MMDMDVIDRLHRAQQNGTGADLSPADVQLLWAVLGDELGKAEREIEKWRETFEDYERTSTREQAQS